MFPRLVAPLRKQEDEIAINMKITEYKTAKGDSADSLDTAVNTLIAAGFQPYEPPYVVGSGVEVLWICQAMVRPE